MTDEEKKAIDIVKNITEDDLLNYWEGPEEPYNAIQIALNLIEKQQENYQSCMDYADSLNRDIGELLLNLEQKDKIINAMAKYIDDTQMEVGTYFKDKNEVIEYFEKKVEGSNE